MKNSKILYLLLASFMLFFSACDPIVEEDHLGNNVKIGDVELKATQTTTGGNEIVLEFLTPGISGHWDYMIGKALTNRYTVTFPVKGTFNFKYKGTLGAEFFEKTVPVTINVLDHPVAPEWTALLGTNAVAGKTWVFDKGGSGNLWWFMSPGGNPEGAMTVWWNAGDCCGPDDSNGKMHFDLNGATNYNHYESKTAAPTKGSFVLDLPNKTLTIVDAKMLGSAAGNKNGVYSIVSLTNDKMVLYLSNSETYNTGWTFIFKPE
jgi:hypothetical protein